MNKSPTNIVYKEKLTVVYSFYGSVFLKQHGQYHNISVFYTLTAVFNSYTQDVNPLS